MAIPTSDTFHMSRPAEMHEEFDPSPLHTPTAVVESIIPEEEKSKISCPTVFLIPAVEHDILDCGQVTKKSPRSFQFTADIFIPTDQYSEVVQKQCEQISKEARGWMQHARVQYWFQQLSRGCDYDPINAEYWWVLATHAVDELLSDGLSKASTVQINVVSQDDELLEARRSQSPSLVRHGDRPSTPTAASPRLTFYIEDDSSEGDNNSSIGDILSLRSADETSEGNNSGAKGDALLLPSTDAAPQARFDPSNFTALNSLQKALFNQAYGDWFDLNV